MPPNDDEIARAIAFFERTDDMAALKQALEQIRPKAAKEARRFAGSDRAPMPAVIEAGSQPADRVEAMRAIREVKDFARLQALARAVGRRIEELRQDHATGD